MTTKLIVICHILVCLWAGFFLTVLPWTQPFGLGEWGDNYLLLYASQATGLQGLQTAVSSGWVRGAVTGLGLLNLGMAFWETINFRRTVRALENAAGVHRTPRPESYAGESRAAAPATGFASHSVVTPADEDSAAHLDLPHHEQPARR